MNFFSADPFLRAAAEQFFPQRTSAIELRRVEQQVLRLLVLDGKEVVRSLPYYDFPQPLESEPIDEVKPLEYFPRTVVLTTSIDEPFVRVPTHQPSPFIRWSAFSDHTEFHAYCEKRGARRSESARQRRRIAKELGTICFTLDDDRSQVFNACIRWKGEQYLASGYENLFARPACVGLFRSLHAQRAVLVSSLFAGPHLLAVHFGAIHDNVFSYWVPAYNREFKAYSPGRVLMEELMRASFELGHREFDFLLGEEPYKSTYATDNRIVGPVGIPPFGERARLKMISYAKNALRDRPRTKELLRRLSRQWRPQ